MNKKIIAIFALCLLGTSAQMLIKKGLSQSGGFDIRHTFSSALRLISNPFILAASACALTAFALYLTVLSRSQLSVLYPMAVGLNFLILGVGSPVFLSEPMTFTKLLGLALILSGISCFALSKAGV